MLCFLFGARLQNVVRRVWTRTPKWRDNHRHRYAARAGDVAIVSYAELTAMSPKTLRERLGTDPAAAAPLILAAARYGFPEAQLVLGQMMLDGNGVERDHRTAVRWFRRAADAGSAEAMNMVGRCYELGWGVPADAVTAVSWYRRAAERGLDWGQYNLANRLLRGDGAPRDRRAAWELYRLAASRGHAKSMNLVARFLEEGWEVPRDPLQALAWYRRSAEAGDFRGQFNFAVALVGMGRIEEAHRWFRTAIDAGTPEFLETAAHDLSKRSEPSLQVLGRLALTRLRCARNGSGSDMNGAA